MGFNYLIIDVKIKNRSKLTPMNASLIKEELCQKTL